MLVQPFVPGIGEHGEWSLVFVDGRFTHAVRKRAAPGDFRVHDDYGGTVEREEPEPALRALAETALATIDQPLLYARVDLVRGRDDQPVVMEMELVEPELFFAHAPDSAARLVDAMVERC
jgi:glutathione synthase/RimK-type ligase-like ATP-grasp enzyme